MTTLAVLETVQAQARVPAEEARSALEKVRGLRAGEALAKLRFGPGRTCEPVARVLDRALVDAADSGLGADQLVVAGGSAEPAEPIVRVRRKAHGKADWISNPTADVRVELQPLGVWETRTPETTEPEAPVAVPATGVSGALATEVREALKDVLDPDLGVNVVDLGFVRGVEVDEHGFAVLTMTLTSPACPLTGVMEDQVRTRLLEETSLVTGFRIEWVWLPTWRPADISEEGREQLRAIGFTRF
ncbi:iron-sulfur cluster assembly protein [Amycolatopsis sp. MEPSY49]|uniref:iron-sulfur cluster assembly protein n=1 Tax=Amycolatopsis sp. MEPSY49 TaxID=3151600 RepID=UPI003EF495BB